MNIKTKSTHFLTALVWLCCLISAPCLALTATEVTRLTPTPWIAGDRFGISVSLDGDTALIGADHFNGYGSAYMFELVGADWIQKDRLQPDAGAEFNDRFGGSVSLDGDTALVGAPWDDDISFRAGAVYVFVRVNGAWEEQAKLTLTAAQGAYDAQFGLVVSLDGDAALIGASQKNGRIGAAFVFERANGVWTQTDELTASDGTAGDTFGYSVSLDGDTALIGATQDAIDSGAAYVFERDVGGWNEQAKLTASDGTVNDQFGRSVSLDGDTALIGVIGDSEYGNLSGAAYVFERDVGGWTEQAKLTASDGALWHFFGISASLDGDTALIGAYGDNENGNVSGAAYVFERDAGGWTEQAKLTASDGTAGDNFGNAVSLDEHTALIGAFWDDSNGPQSGSTYVFTLLPDGVADALAAAGLDPSETPPEVLDALIAADEAGLLEVIPPDTTINDMLRLEPGAAVVLGMGSTVNASIKGPATSTVVIGDNGYVNGNITGVGLSFLGGSTVEVNGRVNTDELLVGPEAQASVIGNGTIGVLEVQEGGSAFFDGNLNVAERLVLGPYTSLTVAGNLRCESGVTAVIDQTANWAIGGRNQCSALQ